MNTVSTYVRHLMCHSYHEQLKTYLCLCVWSDFVPIYFSSRAVMDGEGPPPTEAYFAYLWAKWRTVAIENSDWTPLQVQVLTFSTISYASLFSFPELCLG